MSKVWVTIPTPDGEGVRVTLAQALELARVFDCFEDPVWHVNDCGCCVSVHEHDDGTRGYIVGRDGGSDWVQA